MNHRYLIVWRDDLGTCQTTEIVSVNIFSAIESFGYAHRDEESYKVLSVVFIEETYASTGISRQSRRG